jgi:hypothetical protein
VDLLERARHLGVLRDARHGGTLVLLEGDDPDPGVPRHYLVAYRARTRLDQGRWDDAVEDATYVLRNAQSVPLL